MEIELKVKNKDGTTEVTKYGRQMRYIEKNVKQVKFTLNYNTDADIIEYLEKSGNKQGTIKDALRAYMNK